MKKIIVILMTLLVLASCSSKKEVEIDIDSVSEELLASEDFKGISKMDISKAELKYSVDLSEMENGVICLPTDAERANMFIIAKAKDGKSSVLFDELDMIVDKYDHSWTDLIYNAQEAQKVKDKTIEKIGDYYICVISDDNETIIENIKK